MPYIVIHLQRMKTTKASQPAPDVTTQIQAKAVANPIQLLQPKKPGVNPLLPLLQRHTATASQNNKTEPVIQRMLAVQIMLDTVYDDPKKEEKEKQPETITTSSQMDTGGQVDGMSEEKMTEDKDDVEYFEIDTQDVINFYKSTLLVTEINIAGRPPGPFPGGKEFSHTTAWVVITDMVRNQLLGVGTWEAIKRLDAMYEDLLTLPGMKRFDLLPAEAIENFKAAKGRFNQSSRMTKFAQEQHQTTFVFTGLQEMINAFLSMRNLVPLSHVNDGRAVGKGEPQSVDVVRNVDNYQTNWKQNEESDFGIDYTGKDNVLRTNMWKLLDTATVFKITQEKKNLHEVTGSKGEDESVFHRLIDVLVQHLRTLRNAYAGAYQASQITDYKYLYQYLQSELLLDNETADAAAMSIRDRLAGKILENKDDQNQLEENFGRLQTKGPSGQGGFAVQITLDTNTGRVTGLSASGRANGLLKSEMGSHTIAWITFIDAALTTIRNKDLDTAITDMCQLCYAVLEMKASAFGTNMQQWQQDKYTKAYLKLFNLTGWELENLHTFSNDDKVSNLQALIAAYLALRNVTPLSQSSTGGMADGDAEGTTRARIRYIESGGQDWRFKKAPPAQNEFLGIMWDMLDAKAVSSFFSPQSRVDQPGIGRWDGQNDQQEEDKGIAPRLNGGTTPVVAILKDYLATMQTAYPNATALTQLKGGQSLLWFVLNRLEIQQQYAKEIVEGVLT